MSKELEELCKAVIAAGYSTGHADDAVQLGWELLGQLTDCKELVPRETRSKGSAMMETAMSPPKLPRKPGDHLLRWWARFQYWVCGRQVARLYGPYERKDWPGNASTTVPEMKVWLMEDVTWWLGRASASDVKCVVLPPVTLPTDPLRQPGYISWKAQR